jgi:NitT/TauT family transport system substrate-binding protein
VRKPIAIALAAVLGAFPSFAAAETIKIAVPQRGSWETSFTELGVQQGFFKEQGLDLAISYVADDGAAAKALISGSADIAVASEFVSVLVDYMKGAPIRIISPQATGAPNIFWYAKIAGPVASMKDLHGKAIGYSGPGSLSHMILLTLLKQAGIEDATLLPIGAAANGIPEVLSTELDASWSTPRPAVKDLLSGEIRVIARGNDSPEVQNETLRVNVANDNFLSAHRSAVLGFLRAYKKSVDWAYSGEPALEAYAKLSDQPMEITKYIFTRFASKSTDQLDEIKGEDHVLAAALAAKRIPHAVSHDDIKGIYDLVLK